MSIELPFSPQDVIEGRARERAMFDAVWTGLSDSKYADLRAKLSINDFRRLFALFAALSTSTGQARAALSKGDSHE